MINLHSLKNTDRLFKKKQRVGRGIGSGRGKTSCRGGKGDSARSGYAMNHGRIGGAKPLYRTLPTKGFVNGKFKSEVYSINLSRIESLFNDGETVNLETLRKRHCGPRAIGGGLKILSEGELKKKVTIEAHAYSKESIVKLEKAGIQYKVVELNPAESHWHEAFAKDRSSKTKVVSPVKAPAKKAATSETKKSKK